MRKPIKSDSYEHIKEALGKSIHGSMNDLQNQTEHRTLFHFCYTQRHVKKLIQQDQDKRAATEGILEWSLEIFKKYNPVTPRLGFSNLTIEFINCLVYGFHKKTQKDGFQDLVYEALLTKYDNPIEKIHPDEIESIKALHDLTLLYGYLIIKVLIPPKHNLIWDTFIKSPSKEALIPAQSLYPYPKNGESMGGVQISIRPFTSEINNNWDLVIYYHDEHKISHIKDKLNTLWEKKGKQEIGDNSNYDIALYIDRNACSSISKALEVLRLQISWLHTERFGGFSLFSFDLISPDLSDKNKKSLKSLIDTLEAMRISEGLTEKSWDAYSADSGHPFRF